MTKKLEGNGLWESSRMMLPEHKARIIADNERQGRRERPLLDAARREDIAARLTEAYRSGREVALRLFDPLADRQVRGTIGKVDAVRRRLLVDGEWVALRDIVDIE